MVDYYEVCRFAKSIKHDDVLFYTVVDGIKVSTHVHKFSCAPSVIDIKTFVSLWQNEPSMIHTIYAKEPKTLCVYTLRAGILRSNMLLPALKEWFDENVNKKVLKCEL